MSLYIHQSQLLKFVMIQSASIMLALFLITMPFRRMLLLYLLVPGTQSSDLNFNINKFVHLSFKCKLDITYAMYDTCILRTNSHKDLGLILSEDVSWDEHYKIITACVYKVLGLIRCTLLPNHSTSMMVRLHVSLD